MKLVSVYLDGILKAFTGYDACSTIIIIFYYTYDEHRCRKRNDAASVFCLIRGFFTHGAGGRGGGD